MVMHAVAGSEIVEGGDDTRMFAGFTVRSAIPLPDLAKASAHARVCYRLASVADPRKAVPGPGDVIHRWPDATGRTTLLLRTGHRRAKLLEVPGVAIARIDSLQSMTLWRSQGADVPSFHHQITDQFLPRLLAANGELMLHAAAVTLGDGRAIVLLGDTAQGKSTLCTALVQSGAGLLSDDCERVLLDGAGVRVIPTYPSIRLRPDSLAALYGANAPETAPMADYTDKRRVTARPDVRAVTGVDVAAVFVLQDPPADGCISVARLDTADATMALVKNTFVLDPTDLPQMRHHLAQASTVASRVPIHSIAYPRDYAKLPAVIEQLKFATLQPQ